MPVTHRKERKTIMYDCRLAPHLSARFIAFLLVMAWLDLISAAEPVSLPELGFRLVQCHTPFVQEIGVTGSPISIAELEAGGGRVDPEIPIFEGKEFEGLTGGSSQEHSTAVGSILFGNSLLYQGVAPGIRHVFFGDAGSFLKTWVQENKPVDVRIINQSFSLSRQVPALDLLLDAYADEHHILFVNGSDGPDGGVGHTPSTMFNGICVGACDPESGDPSFPGGLFEKRSLPELVAPITGSYFYYQRGSPVVLTNQMHRIMGTIAGTSLSAPFVSGASALVMDLALRRPETSQGSDPRVVKAILMSSATKGITWAHTEEAPLDTRQGAGVLNVTAALRLFQNGSKVDRNQDAGWNLENISSDETKKYSFTLKDPSSFTATIAWNRHIQDSLAVLVPLELRLLREDHEIAISVSQADNFQHLFVKELQIGDYRLEVHNPSKQSETFGLAWSAFPMR